MVNLLTSIIKMNSELLKLFDTYTLSEKDRYEITQIFNLLDTWKKQHLIRNFDTLVKNIRELQDEIRIEQEILIWDVLADIQNAVDLAKQKTN